MTFLAISGSNGFLGSYLSDFLGKSSKVLRLRRSHSEKSLGQENLVDSWKRQILDHDQIPDMLINCAAMTDVNGCEMKSDLATEVNSLLPGMLAAMCHELGMSMIQISTDAVYGGSKPPSDEDTVPKPLSVYARSKLDGESRVESACRALVLRVNFFGANPRGKSILDYFSREKFNSNPRIGFTNFVTSTVHISTLAENIRSIALSSNQERPQGILNLGSSNSMSKYEFGDYIARAKGFASPIKGAFAASYLRDDEVYDLSMDSSLARQHGLKVPTVESEIEKAMRTG